MVELLEELLTPRMRDHFFCDGCVIFGGVLKIGYLTLQLAVTGIKQGLPLLVIDKYQRHAFIIVEKGEVFVDTPIIGYGKVGLAAFVVEGAVGTGRAGTKVAEEQTHIGAAAFMGGEGVAGCLKDYVKAFPAGSFIAEVYFSDRLISQSYHFIQSFLVDLGTGDAVTNHVNSIKLFVVAAQVAFQFADLARSTAE